METNKKEAASNTNSNANAANGFDLSGLMSGGAGEVIKYLLSTGGAVLINYLMSIKPMQDKIEALTKKADEQEKRINYLEDDRDELVEKLNRRLKGREQEQELLHGDDDEYFSVKKQRSAPNQKSRRYLLD